jgi:type IV secretory pathway TrbD component
MKPGIPHSRSATFAFLRTVKLCEVMSSKERVKETTMMRPLKVTLAVIGIVQVFFGLLFVIAPGQFATLFHFPVAPAWTNWLLVMGGARFLGMGYGMFVAMRDPMKHRTWIQAMIGIQVLDWLTTISNLLTGVITLSQASTATFLPIVFIVALLVFYPREQSSIGEQEKVA